MPSVERGVIRDRCEPQGAGASNSAEAKAEEGSLVAPEIAKVDASRKLFSWQIRRMHEPADTEYSSTACRRCKVRLKLGVHQRPSRR